MPSDYTKCQGQPFAHSGMHQVPMAGMGANHWLSILCRDLGVSRYPGTHWNWSDDAVASANKHHTVYRYLKTDPYTQGEVSLPLQPDLLTSLWNHWLHKPLSPLPPQEAEAVQAALLNGVQVPG